MTGESTFESDNFSVTNPIITTRRASTLMDVYDGDTITVDVDLGMGLSRNRQSIRLWKVNTPEVRGASKEEGKAVRDWTEHQDEQGQEHGVDVVDDDHAVKLAKLF